MLELQPDLNPLVKTAVIADEIKSLATARIVKRRLNTDISPETLRGAISTRVGSTTLFVEVTAAWSDPQFAADLANAFTQVPVDTENRDLARNLRSAIAQAEKQARGPLVDENTNLNVSVFNARNQLSALRSLQSSFESGGTVPAEIARTAEEPTVPSTPRTARNTVLGLIVGLALGLVAAFARDALDRRIRTSRDAHDRFGWAVLGRVGQTALGSTGAAPSVGTVIATPADIEAFRILRTNLSAISTNRPLRSVLITSGLPQEGKSSVAAGLAAAAAAAGQRTLLVDADLRRPVLAKRFGLKPSPGLAQYLGGAADPKSVLRTIKIKPGSRGLRHSGEGGTGDDGGRSLVCIPAGDATGEPAELLASERCREFIATVSRGYDLVVIDSPPLLATADPLELMPYVDVTLLCVRLGASTADEAEAVQDAIALLPDNKVGLVATGAGDSDGYYGYYGY